VVFVFIEVAIDDVGSAFFIKEPYLLNLKLYNFSSSAGSIAVAGPLFRCLDFLIAIVSSIALLVSSLRKFVLTTCLDTS